MEYRSRINFADSFDLYDIPQEEGMPYIQNVKMKDSTSLDNNITLGTSVSKMLTFSIKNSPVDIFDGMKLVFAIKAEDVGEADVDLTDLELTDEEVLNNLFEPAPDDMKNEIEFTPEQAELIQTGFEEDGETIVYEVPVEDEELSEEEEGTPDNEVYREDELSTETVAEDGEVDDYVQMGEFYVTNIRVVDEVYYIEALDGFILMNRSYVPTNPTATVEEMYNDFILQLDQIGITCNEELEYPSITIHWDISTTFREAAGYFAGLMGGYATFDRNGALDIRQYMKNADISLIEEDVKSLEVNTDGTIYINGMICDTDITALTNYIKTSDDADEEWTINFTNPFMTQEVLLDIYQTYYEYLQYTPARAVLDWQDGIRAGDLIQIGEDWILITNQTIDFGAGSSTIDSLGTTVTRSEGQIENPVVRQVQRVQTKLSSNIQVATELANEASAIAEATGQHFWNVSESEYFTSADEEFVTWKTYYTPDTHTEITLPNETHTLENTDSVTVNYNIARIISIENAGVKWDESIYTFSGNTITFDNVISGPIDVVIKYVPDVVPVSLLWEEKLGAGAYVTEAEQEQFIYHPSGKNSLWNSLGMLFRNGLNNLLSILSGGTEGTGARGIAIYDGEGNSDENIVASFTDQGSVIGKEGENRLEISPYKIEAKDLFDNTYWQVKDLRENNVTLLYDSDATTGKTDFPVPCASEIVSVLIDGIDYEYYTFNDADTNEASISIDSAWSGHQLEITYTVSQSENVHPYVFNFLSDTNVMQGAGSFNEGLNCYSMGAFSHAEGVNTQTLSHACHSEGLDTESRGMASHAEGSNTRAERDYSHAEGLGAVAGLTAHAEGFNTEAGNYAHAEGYTSKAMGISSHAQNRGTKASSNDQTALGRYNVEDTNGQYAVIVGNGTSENARSNALTIDWNGKGIVDDTVEVARDPSANLEVATKQYVDNSISGFIPVDDLFFKPGDVYSVTYNHARALTGYVSSSTSGIYFEIPLPKFLTDVTGATITAMYGGVRGISGYVDGLQNNSNLKSSTYRVTASVDNPNTLYVSVVKLNSQGQATALSNVTNNTPVSVALNSISITFS